MAATGFDTGQIGRHKRTGNADIRCVAQQSFGIAQLKRQPQHRANGCKGDIPLGPVQTNAQNLFALPFLPADHTIVDHRRCV
jgi:hypothetical protein